MDWKTLGRAGIASVAFLLFSAESLGIEERELQCEGAVAHLIECCPDFDPALLNCNSVACSRTPDLSLGESQCLLDKSCAAIRSAGYCKSFQGVARDGTLHHGQLDGGIGLCAK